MATSEVRDRVIGNMRLCWNPGCDYGAIASNPPDRRCLKCGWNKDGPIPEQYTLPGQIVTTPSKPLADLLRASTPMLDRALSQVMQAQQPTKRRREDPEGELQAECVRWFRETYPKSIIFAIPNGGARSKREAGRMKMQGVLAGVPDLFIAAVRQHGKESWRNGCFIEMKANTNQKSSASQVRMQRNLRCSGYVAATCHDLEEFQAVVIDYMQ